MHFTPVHSWNACLGAWERIVKKPENACVHKQNVFNGLRKRRPSVLLDGSRWCLDHCLEPALVAALGRAGSGFERTLSHRVPLGLLLVSRRELTPEQLRLGLDEQRRRGFGKLGECLEALGFVGEQQITAALARQWSCPVSKINSVLPRSAAAPQVPLALLERFSMIPLDYVASSHTLFLAFAEAIDYSVLYAIEQMMGCRTEGCMALPSFVRTSLQVLAAQQQRLELVFENLRDTSELCRIVRSYCVRLSASEIRLAACGPYRWIRMLRDSSSISAVDLLMCLPPNYSVND
jgi:hypothetical protein